MIYNAQFTSYRQTLGSGKYDYSASATITAGWGYMEQLGSELRAILGIAQAVEAYTFLTEETNIQVSDKFVINSTNYYVSELENFNYNGIIYKKAVITKDT
jgi:hypothetical protein